MKKLAKSIMIASLIISWNVTFTSCSNPLDDIAHDLVYNIDDQLLNPERYKEREEAQRQQERFDNLVNWKVGCVVDQESINKFGYDNCFQIMDDSNPDGLCFVRYLRYNNAAGGEMSQIGGIVCDKRIASDLLYIFRELYEAKCMVGWADSILMEQQQGLGVVVDCENPLSANDLAVRLFKEKGFTWGGEQPDGNPNCFTKSVTSGDFVTYVHVH